MYKIIGIVAVLCVLLPEAMTIVSRDDWGARPPKAQQTFEGPAPFVVIHHSYQPAACFSAEECREAMKIMQDMHQNDRGWSDIGYTFAIGGDGQIYEGRGFNVVGAHAPGYNDKSVGICMIGDWRSKLPPQQMLEAAHDLIDYGVSKGYIAKNFKLIGHRQVKETECPGDRLFNEILTWPHWGPIPRNVIRNEIPTK